VQYGSIAGFQEANWVKEIPLELVMLAHVSSDCTVYVEQAEGRHNSAPTIDLVSFHLSGSKHTDRWSTNQ
jgi:hypothetical protein